MDEIITTVIRRPYVFAFLAAYLFLAWRLWGWRRTVLWLVSGYAIAWASEFSSITNGFPYGEYHYIYENMPGELMVAGVPFFDSLSYPFLIFAGFTMAQFTLKRSSSAGSSLFTLHSSRSFIFLSIILGSILTMLLDVVIDPVAKLGDQWFLGNIYWYANPGWYFGIPLTNFAGWFLVPLIVISFNMLAWNIFPRFFRISKALHSSHFTLHAFSLLYPAFYFSIALFNIVISFWIGAVKLGITSSALMCIILGIAILVRRNLQGISAQGEV